MPCVICTPIPKQGGFFWGLSFLRPPQTRKQCCKNIASLMFPRLRRQETFVAEIIFASEKQNMFLTFYLETFRFFNKCFPVCALRKRCFLDFRLHFINWACAVPYRIYQRTPLVLKFPVKCFFVCAAMKHCFSLVCAHKKHSGKQCFRNNVSSFAGAFSK